jgi:outer membrane protein assembly factor BamA
VIFVVLLLVAAAAAAWSLRARWLGPMVAARVVQELGARLGGTWTVASVGGSYVNDIDIHGLKWVQPGAAGPLRACSVDDVAVSYDLHGLLSDQPLAAISRIRLRGVDITVDLTQPLPGPSGTAAATIPPLPWAATLDISGNVTVVTAPATIAARNLHLTGRLDHPALSAEIAVAGKPLGPLSVQAQHAGPDALVGWQGTGSLGAAQRVEFAATNALNAAPRPQVTLSFGDGNSIAVVHEADRWTVDARVDLARVPRAIRDLAGLAQVTVPAVGTAQAIGAYARDGSIAVERASAAMPGLTLRLGAAHWSPDHGLSDLAGGHVQVDLATWVPALATHGATVAGEKTADGPEMVVDISATAGRVACSAVGNGLPGSIGVTLHSSGDLFSAAWRNALIEAEVKASWDPLVIGTLHLGSGLVFIDINGDWSRTRASWIVQVVGLATAPAAAPAAAAATVLRVVDFSGMAELSRRTAHGSESVAITAGADLTAVLPSLAAGWSGLPLPGLPLTMHADVSADSAGTSATVAMTTPLAMSATAASPVTTGDFTWLRDPMHIPVRAAVALSGTKLAAFANLLPAGLYVDGDVSASATAAGTVAKPDWAVTASLRHASLGGLPPLPPLLDISADIRATPTLTTVVAMQAHAGGGVVTVVGVVPYPVRAPDDAWDLGIVGTDALLFQRPDLRVRADAHLRLHGTRDEPQLSGTVHLTDLVVTTPVSWFSGQSRAAQESPLDAFNALPAPWSRTKLDLHVTGGGLDAQGRASSPLAVRNNVVVAQLALDLTIGGVAAVPVLVGQITSNAGHISLPFSSYEIQSALLRFLPGDPFNPVIDATATTQMAGYTLTVQVSRTLINPRIEVSSSPPLDPSDALILASTGQLPADAARSNAASSAAGIALPLIGNEVKRWIVGDNLADDDQDSVFDRLVLRYDEDRSANDLPTIRLEFRVIGQYFLYCERDIWEADNIGVLWRWLVDKRPEVKAKPIAAVDQGAAGKPADWRVIPATAGDHLPLSEGTLLGTVPETQRRGSDALEPAQLASAAQRMVDRLQDEGYPDAMVQPRIHPAEHTQTAPAKDGTPKGDFPPEKYAGSAAPGFPIVPAPRPESARTRVVVDFLVSPGLPWQVASIAIAGAPPALATAIRTIVDTALPRGTALTPTALGDCRTAVRAALITAGYAKVKVTTATARRTPDSQEAYIRVDIDAGLAYRLAVPAPTITGSLPADHVARLTALCAGANGTPYSRLKVIQLRNDLIQHLRDAGYAFAKVEVTCDEPDERAALDCTVHIAAGLPVILDSISISGFLRTSLAYVRHRLGLHAGDVLHDRNLEDALSRLRSAGVATTLRSELVPVVPAEADPAGADAKGGATQAATTQPARLDITVQEAPARTLEVYSGYGSYEGVRGGAKWIDNNVFGLGRGWEFGGDVSQKSYGGRTRITDHDLLGTQPVTSLTFDGHFREEPSFDDTSYIATLEVRAPLHGHFDAAIDYSIDAERATRVAADLIGTERTGFVLDGSLGGTLTWDNRDDRQLPTKGGVAQIGAAIADPLLGSQVSYVEVSSRLGWVLPLVGDRLIAAAQVAGQVRKPTRDVGSLPIQYRHFLGGPSNVRSFGLDQLSPVAANNAALGGLSTAFTNLELRLRVWGAFHVAGFYDAGVVSEDAWSIRGADGQAIGLGLRYYLPVGPIRVDAAYNPGNRYADRSPYAIDVAAGFTF